MRYYELGRLTAQDEKKAVDQFRTLLIREVIGQDKEFIIIADLAGAKEGQSLLFDIFECIIKGGYEP